MPTRTKPKKRLESWSPPVKFSDREVNELAALIDRDPTTFDKKVLSRLSDLLRSARHDYATAPARPQECHLVVELQKIRGIAVKLNESTYESNLTAEAEKILLRCGLASLQEALATFIGRTRGRIDTYKKVPSGRGGAVKAARRKILDGAERNCMDLYNKYAKRRLTEGYNQFWAICKDKITGKS